MEYPGMIVPQSFVNDWTLVELMVLNRWLISNDPVHQTIQRKAEKSLTLYVLDCFEEKEMCKSSEFTGC